jgi:hypothetical protein
MAPIVAEVGKDGEKIGWLFTKSTGTPKTV